MTADTRATLVVIVATCCAVMPLRALFSDTGWIYGVWIAVVLILAPAAALRMRWQAHIAQVLPGIVLVIGYLTARYLSAQSLGGLIPWHGSGGQVATYGSDLGDYIRDSVSPSPSIPAALFVLTLVMAAVAVFSDAIAVVFRAGALLAGPYLLILTLSASVPRQPVPWWCFALVAAGYLLLLSDGSRQGHLRWGPLMAGRDQGSRDRTYGSVAATGVRVGAAAVVAALVLAALVPNSAHNSLADAMHHSDSGNGDSKGNGSGTSLDPFVNLRGQLTRSDPVALLSVHITTGDPYYLRQLVLDDFTGTRWQPGPGGSSSPLRPQNLPLSPNDPPVNPSTYDAQVTISGLVGNAPTLQSPSVIRGLARGTNWDPKTAVLSGAEVHSGDQYTVTVRAPQPSIPQLDAVPDASVATKTELAADLALPANLPGQIATQANAIVTGQAGPFRKARAVSQYFTDPANGFIYTLSTKLGDSGNDLVDFLTNKQGFCQQYAAAMAVMLRILGIPARVVIGYTHESANESGNFAVTTNDAHAWVEAYFTGIGWTAFDPTPLGGVNASRAQRLPYVSLPTAATPAPSATTPDQATPVPEDLARDRATAAAPQNKATSSSFWSGRSGTILRWAIVGVMLLVVILLLPAGRRLLQRRRRLAASGADPLWDELTATARDLGYVWAPSRSPQQVTRLLSTGALPESARRGLATLSSAVELARYARPTISAGRHATADDPAERDALLAELKSVETALRGNRPRRVRVRARLLPYETTQRLRRSRGRFSLRRPGS